MKFRLLAILAAVTALGAAQALSVPKPSEGAASWELEFDSHEPQAIQVQTPGQKEPRTFWFVRYTITNHSGEDRIFVPDFVLYTDTGQAIRAGRGVPPTVFDAIKKVYNDPLLKDQTGITGRLLQGDDQAKSGLAIFQDFDPEAGVIDLFVGNLTGETAEVELPEPVTVKEMDKNGKFVEVTKTKMILSRTLDLKYRYPTNNASVRGKMTLLEKSWVMR